MSEVGENLLLRFLTKMTVFTLAGFWRTLAFMHLFKGRCLSACQRLVDLPTEMKKRQGKLAHIILLFCGSPVWLTEIVCFESNVDVENLRAFVLISLRTASLACNESKIRIPISLAICTIVGKTRNIVINFPYQDKQ